MSDDWRTARACGICGVRDIPYGIDWPWWREGKCVHPACCMRRDAAAAEIITIEVPLTGFPSRAELDRQYVERLMRGEVPGVPPMSREDAEQIVREMNDDSWMYWRLPLASVDNPRHLTKPEHERDDE